VGDSRDQLNGQRNWLDISVIDLMLTRDSEKFTSVYDFFKRGLTKTVNGKFLAERSGDAANPGPFEWITYQDGDKISRQVGQALVERFKLAQHKNACVGAFLPNSIPFVMMDTACSAYGFVCVPVYDTYDSDAVRYILNHTELEVLLTVPHLLPRIIELQKDLKFLKHIIVAKTDKVDEAHAAQLKTTGIETTTWSDVLAKSPGTLAPSPATGDEWYTLCFTSGTTGTPKGAILAHDTVIAHNAGVIRNIMSVLKLDPATDVHYSYLPLGHIYERVVSLMMIYHGLPIGIYRGNPLAIIPDAQALKPTIFPGVPRVLNRVCDQVRAGAAKDPGYEEAYNAKKKMLYETGAASNTTEWDTKTFKKYQMALGGNVRVILSASAPISAANLEFLRIVMGATTLEAYGQTENCGAISMTLPQDIDINVGSHVGSVNPALEVKLEDVPEMNYRSTDKPFPRGEICVRGPCVMRGYLKNEEQTAATIDKDGWLHTGDIVSFIRIRHDELTRPGCNLGRRSNSSHGPQEAHFQAFARRVRCSRAY